ncbi:MAG: sulfate ABC transporter substrate-binding protein [Isosphaeraceae bacterium]
MDRWLVGMALAVGLAFPAGCARSEAASDSDRLTIGAYSVVREALHEGLLPAFADEWRGRTGRSVRFEESYNASGAQARAIAAGLDADVAILSMDSDLDILAKAGLPLERRGVVSRSLVVIGVRPGNPRAIADWADLAQPGVSVVYPDPKTSGGARWNINAIYGSGLRASGKEAARELLASIQRNVVAMDSSGRQSLATFERGTGDAIVTYENELRLATKMTHAEHPYVVPPQTLLIESPAALVAPSLHRHGNREVAEAFLDFLAGPRGQAILAEYGFRALDAPLPEGVFAMKDLGGWKAMKAEVYDAGGVWDSLFSPGGRR